MLSRKGSITTASSRLSPFAPPFTVDLSNHPQPYVASKLVKSSSGASLNVDTVDGAYVEYLPSYVHSSDAVEQSGYDLEASGLCYPSQMIKNRLCYEQYDLKQSISSSKDNGFLKTGLHAASRPKIVTSSDYISSNSNNCYMARNAERVEVDQCSSTIRRKDLKDNMKLGSSSIENRTSGDSFCIKNSDQKVCSPNLCITTERCSAVSDRSSEKLDEDLDSPCWKGTLAPHQTSAAAGFSPHSDKQITDEIIEDHKSLNPLAPQFFPSNARATASSVSSLCREKGLRNHVEAVPFLTESSGFEEPYSFTRNTNYDSGLYSTRTGHPSLMEEHFLPKGQLDIVNVSADATDVSLENGYALPPPYDTDYMSALPCYGTNSSSELAEKTQNSFNINCATPKLDVHMLVDKLCNLSELLKQSCSSDMASLTELDHSLLQHAMNNLQVCMKKKVGVGQTDSVPEFPVRNSLDWVSKSTGLSKERRMAASFSNPYADQTGDSRKEGFSEFISHTDHRATASCSFHYDGDFEKNIDISQAVEKILVDDDSRVRMPSQVLLYKNLWIKAEAALCSMKREALVARMNTQFDGGHANDKLLLGDNGKYIPLSSGFSVQAKWHGGAPETSTSRS